MPNFNNSMPPDHELIANNMICITMWQNSSKKSFLSDLWLRTFIGTPLFLNCFARVLNPVKYPYFNHYLKNVILLTPGEHALWHQGSEEERIGYALTIEQNSRGEATADWNKLKALAIELKEEYQEYFPLTKNGIVGYRYPLDEQGKIISKLNKKFLSENK